MMEKDMLLLLKQMMVKEHMVGEINLSHVDKDFYDDVREYLKGSSNDEARVLFAQFKRSRITKLLRLACAFTNSTELSEFLTPEELILYRNITDELERYWQ